MPLTNILMIFFHQFFISFKVVSKLPVEDNGYTQEKNIHFIKRFSMPVGQLYFHNNAINAINTCQRTQVRIPLNLKGAKNKIQEKSQISTCKIFEP